MGRDHSLQSSELRYRRLFEAAQDGILILDAGSGSITDVNPFLINMLGYSRDELIEKKLWEVGAFADIKTSKEAFLALQENEYIRYKDLPLRAKDGKLIPVEYVSNVYYEGEEKVIQCNIRDISERKHDQDVLMKSHDLLKEQSVRDHLTGLFNRRYLEETLEREIHRASRKNTAVGVIMLDVDNFKLYNDEFGHPAGDVVLRKLGAFLLSHIREEDVACRFGGDEFIIVLPEASRKATLLRGKYLQSKSKLIDLEYKGHKLKNPAFSFGISVFPEDGSESTELLSSVDKALYNTKWKLNRLRSELDHPI